VKKKLIYIGLALVVLAALALVVSVLSLGRIVKNRVEAIGPQVTQTAVTLDSAAIWLFPGRASFKGLTIGNPSHYKTKVAIAFGKIHVRVNPFTAFSRKIVIDTIQLESPEVTIEGGLKKNNLTEIEKNMNDYMDGTNASPSAPAQANATTNAHTDRTFQVNELVITGARLHVISLFNTGANVSMSLPEIRMASLGQGPDGITSAELGQKVLKALLNSIAENAADTVSNLGKEAVSKAKKFDFKKAGEKLKGLFGQ